MPFDRSQYTNAGIASEADLLEEGEGELVDIAIEDEDGEDGDKFYRLEGGEFVEISDEDELPDEPEWDDNLADYIDDKELSSLASDLVTLYRDDRQDRSEWEETNNEGLRLLGFKSEKRTQPWMNACGVFHPLLAEAVVRYVSEAIMEAYPPTGPANTSIIGDHTPELLKRAKRVKDELNYQLTVRMPESRPELEMTFFRQCVMGSCFRKTFYDPILRRPTKRMVPAEDLVVCYGTSDLLTSKRYTHVERVSENTIRKLMAMGFYSEIDLQESSGETEQINDTIDELSGISKPTGDSDRTRLEMYVDLDLPGFEDEDDGELTGVELPYIVTIDLDSEKILSIRRNYTQDDKYVKRSSCFSEYHYIRGFGFYGLGLIHILGGTADMLTSILRQLVDAGTLSNIPAGYKGKGLRVSNKDEPLAPGELRDVDVLAGTLKENLVWMPMKEPSPVLLQLLGVMVDEGRRIGSVADMKIADTAQNSPVGTTLALIERVMRVMSAVQARNNIAMGQELSALAKIIREKMGPNYDYPVLGEYSRVEDFGPPINVIPVADPSATTISQRLIRYRAALDLAREQPHLYDMALLHRGAMETMQIPNADRIVPLKDDFDPLDPVTENMNIMMMRPIKAFMHQDHESHLQVHMAALQDPLILQVIGQSPNAAAIQAAGMAHIQEHIAYAYRRRMEEAAGFAMPDPQNPIPPDMEAQISPLLAAAADKVLQRDTSEAARQKAAQEAQDPLLAIEKEKLRLKGMELDIRAKTEAARVASADRKMMIEKEIEDMRGVLEAAELALRAQELAMTEGNKREIAQAQIESKERIAAVSSAVTRRRDEEKHDTDKQKLTQDKNNARKPRAKTNRKNVG